MKIPLLAMLLLWDPAPSWALMESRWWTLSSGGEATWHHDGDPVMFQDAQGRTASLYAGAGAGKRWSMLGGIQRMDLWQEWWRYRGLTRMGLGKVAVGAHWGVEVLGHATTHFQDTWYGSDAQAPDSALHTEGTQWTAGAGLSWCPDPIREMPQTLSLRLMRASSKADSGGGRPWSGELAVAGWGSWGEWFVEEKVAVLGNRRRARNQVAGLFNLAARRGRLGVQARVMAGAQDHWYEAERLVVHDGATELRSAVSLGLSWQLWKGLGVEGSVGQDQTEASRSRWAFASLRWTHQHWAPLE